ncbi:hypothetical protein JAAARDRAFT_127473 [Jaapia argillacea MUCL 33604]|uniref:Uncharacterized protein n=1 Tax=Jaapia argillacea MUCL 33604 TaxID=933084 RepID=A0A067PXA6_9AGAM|nr:hypothetical protein JAAARDRAFT_127473 [Jaapia argillacea MUCL 33604]
MLEEELRIVTRWTTTTPEFQNGLKVLHEWKYRRAIDNLEHLIVQRMFKLTKLGMSGLGYKLREKIGKALKACSEAIQKALDEYNRCAQLLDPPSQPLTWATVVEAVSLADFNLFQQSRQDIQHQDWAHPVHREAMNLYFSIKHACEELVHLNVEIRHLISFMVDEHIDYHGAIALYMICNLSLAHTLQTQWIYRQCINNVIVSRLLQTSELSGFTGLLQHGI